MEIVIIINTLAFLALIVYIVKKESDDKVKIVRELTKSLLAKDISEYVEAIPEDEEVTEDEESDELEDVDSVDERILIKHLNEEYGNNES